MKIDLLYIILCVLLILTLYDYFNSTQREEFTPFIRSFYRPCERKIREGYGQFYNKMRHRSNMLFRKMGIL